VTKPNSIQDLPVALRSRIDSVFANIKYLHSICESAINGLSACPEVFHVDAEPEAVRLDIGKEFHRMSADEATALGSRLIMAAFKQQQRSSAFSCSPRLDPKWLMSFLEGLMKDWPKVAE
jgi:hypothetical protein